MVSEQIIINQFDAAKHRFPKLNKPKLVGGTWEINGCIDVIDDEGSIWDSYDVKIVVPANYPNELFELFETGNKIPKDPNWHNSISCCLSTNAVMFSEMEDNLSLLNWLEKFAHPFLANHVYKVKTGSYASKEFDHGEMGIIQGYFQVFKTTELSTVIRNLRLVSRNKKNGRNFPCFCNSGKKYKHCCLINPKSHYWGIPTSVLQSDLKLILKYNKK